MTAMKPTTVDDLIELLRLQGGAQYGMEAVTQLEHALQCAQLAIQANASASLVTACLLHDVGHLLHDLGEDVADRGIDDRHEYRANAVLKALFGPAVTEPVRLHVEAKRYLCAVDQRYWQQLSPASQHSLTLQGGIFSDEAAAQFIQQPYAPEAAQLRQWDDQAKVAGLSTQTLDDLRPLLEKAVI